MALKRVSNVLTVPFRSVKGGRLKSGVPKFARARAKMLSASAGETDMLSSGGRLSSMYSRDGAGFVALFRAEEHFDGVCVLI